MGLVLLCGSPGDYPALSAGILALLCFWNRWSPKHTPVEHEPSFHQYLKGPTNWWDLLANSTDIQRSVETFCRWVGSSTWTSRSLAKMARESRNRIRLEDANKRENDPSQEGWGPRHQEWEALCSIVSACLIRVMVFLCYVFQVEAFSPSLKQQG